MLAEVSLAPPCRLGCFVFPLPVMRQWLAAASSLLAPLGALASAPQVNTAGLNGGNRRDWKLRGFLPGATHTHTHKHTPMYRYTNTPGITPLTPEVIR